MTKRLAIIKSSKLDIHWLFEPRDLWLGVFWDKHVNALDIYLCLLPCLPLRFRYKWELSLPEGFTWDGQRLLVDGQPFTKPPDANDVQELYRWALDTALDVVEKSPE